MFKMLTNPQYFSSLKWKDQRDILMKLVSEVSDVELAQTDAKYAPLLSELEKAPSTDDIRAKFSKALYEWKKKQAEIPVRIDEAEKSKVDVDVAEQELLMLMARKWNFPRPRNRIGLRSAELIRYHCRETQILMRLTAIQRVNLNLRLIFPVWHRARKCLRC